MVIHAMEDELSRLFNWRTAVRFWLGLAMFSAVCGCSRAAVPANSVQMPPDDPVEISLALVGYNYTDRYIDSFTVDGKGGGNLAVSSFNSGGGGSVCCITYWPGLEVYKVKVRWQHGACFYRVRSRTSGEVFDELHSFYKEMEVVVDGSSAKKPANFEVHFYPDGTVQAAVTDSISMPRLSLSKQREDKARYPRCPDEQKPRK